MHPYRQPWGYPGYPQSATTYPSDPATAYASYYSQMYGGNVQAAAPVPPPTPQYHAPTYTEATPTYSSDFSSGATGFPVPPPIPRGNPAPKYRHSSNLQEVRITPNPPLPTQTINKPVYQRPAAAPPTEVRPRTSNWQELKNVQAATNSTLVPAVAAASSGPKLPAKLFPMKRFVKPQNETNPEEQEEGPVCHRIADLAVFNKVTVVYEKITEQVSPGVFGVRLKLGSELYTGTGSSFKLAKEAAAGSALSSTSYTKPVYKSTMKTRPLGITATQELFELATKKGQTPTFVFLQPANFEFKPAMRQWTKDEMRSYYKVKLSIGGKDFIGEADLPQQAKHNAAVQALPLLNSMPDVQQQIKAATGGMAGAEAAGSDVAATDVATLGTLPNGKNVIMVLNEIAMHKCLTIDWTMVGEFGPPHKRSYVWSMKLGDYEAKGSGLSKKVAKTVAAINIYETIPAEWKECTAALVAKKKKKNKRKADDATHDAAPPAKIPALNAMSTTTNIKMEAEAQKRPVHQVVLAAHPVSALFEYCKKAKQPDPEFEVVSENVLETWPKENKTFKKTEYTMKLTVDGKVFFASGMNKKAAKTAVATEAWNLIRTGTM